MKLVLTLAALAASSAMAQPGQPAPPLASRSLNSGQSSSQLPPGLAGVGIQQKLDNQLPLHLKFRDEYGQEVALGKYFESKKPVLLAPVYYRCPMLCTQIMSGLEGALRAVAFNPGQDFEIVAFSFDPKDSPETALAKKEMYMKRYRRPDTKNGWHFLTGDEESIKALTAALGYGYQYDPKTDQYAHASGVMIATPQGRLSKYLRGRVFAAGPAARAGGGVGEQDRQSGGRAAALLLPLRSGDRQVRRGRDEHDPVRRRRVHADRRHVPAHHVPPRFPPGPQGARSRHGGSNRSQWVKMLYFRCRHPRSLRTWTT